MYDVDVSFWLTRRGKRNARKRPGTGVKDEKLKVYMTQNFFLLYFAVLYIQKPILNLKLA